MFHALEKYRTPAQILLALIGISFIGFGVAGFELSHRKNYIVKVGSREITRNDLEQAIRNTRTSGGNPDRNQVFQDLVSQAYLYEAANRLGITVSDEQIKQAIVDNPDFQDANKKFSAEIFRQVLAGSGLTEERYMALAREHMMTLELMSLLGGGSYADVQAAQMLNVVAAVRTVRSSSIDARAFADKVTGGEAEWQKFYEAHKKQYIQAQGLKFQYIKISPKLLADKQTVTEEEIKQALETGKSSLKTKHRIAHILIQAPASADAASKEKAKAEAEKIAAEAKADPSKFAELAKKYSQDPSKDNGGEIGQFAPDEKIGGSQPLTDAAFALKKGQVSGVVQSEFGYHILYAMEVSGADAESQKAEAVQTLKEKKAQQEFNTLRETISQLAFDHADDLKPTADKAGVTVQTPAEWLTRANAQELKIPKAVADALFGEELFGKKHNSEAINADGETWFVRVVETRPEAVQSFAQVKERVKEDYIEAESQRLAKAYGQTVLAELQAGKNPVLAWSETEEVLPQQLQAKLPPEAYTQLMKAMPKNGKPAYALLDTPAPLLVEVQSVKSAVEGRPQMLSAVKKQMGALASDTVLRAYIDTLRAQVPTEQGSEKVQDDPQ